MGAADPIAVKQAFIGQFYGTYFTWVGIGRTRSAGYFSCRGCLSGSEFAEHCSYCPPLLWVAIVCSPRCRSLTIALTTKIFENSTDYSIENTARHALFLPVSREAKYKAKTAIDNSSSEPET